MLGKSSYSINTNRQVKFPIISLPGFGGQYDEWFTLKDTFRSMIHDKHDTDDLEKLHNLRAALKGEAAKVVMSLKITKVIYAIYSVTKTDV